MFSAQTRSSVRFKAALLAFSAFAVPAVALAMPTQALAQQAEDAYSFNLPAQPLARSLASAARIAGVQFILPEGEASRAQAPAVRGRMTLTEALVRLTAGSGYEAYFSTPGTLTLRRLPPVGNGAEPADGSRVLSSVLVEGAQSGAMALSTSVNGVNGSTDVTATEGTGSYTTNALTVGGRTPRSLQETPQSVSVLTSERLEDQNVVDLTEAMAALPGITVTSRSTDRQVFTSRGFEIDRLSIDGGAPLNISPDRRYGLNPQIDMALYDHVELLRGADGVVNAYGDPGGVINLVRKKPLEFAQVSAELGGDTWGARRGVLDVTGPVALDGRLRARAVVTRSEQEYFYDTVEQTRDLYYGILEFEPMSGLVLSLGLTKSDQGGVSWASGLPRGLDGSDLGLPRETAFTFPWSTYSVATDEWFAGLDYEIGSGWDLKLKFSEVKQDGERNNAAIFGAVDPATGDGAGLSLNQESDRSRQTSADLIVNGEFSLFGREQTLTFGANYSKAGAPGYKQYYTTTTFPPVNVYTFDPTDFPAPDRTLSYGIAAYGYEQYGSFATLGLSPVEKLKVNLGVRYSAFKFYQREAIPCGAIFSIPELGIDCQSEDDTFSTVDGGSDQSNFSWPPSASVIYTLNNSLSLYGSYADVYQDQSLFKDINGESLDPVEGYNIEAGIRWTGRDGRLNASASIYSIKQDNFPLAVTPETYFPDGSQCCYSAADQTYLSRGVDLEVTGELFDNFQIAASYTYNSNERRGADSGTGEGQPVSSRFPEHLAKLWASYKLSGQGWVNRLTVGGGVQAQSSGFYAGAVCLTPLAEVFPGYFACPSPQPYDFTQKGYAVVSAFASYKFTDALSLDLNVNNVFDETYYATVGLAEQGNWYGEPLSASITLRGRW